MDIGTIQMQFPEVSLFVQQRGDPALDVEGQELNIYDGREFVPFKKMIYLKQLRENDLKYSLLINEKVAVLYHEDCTFSMIRGKWVSLKGKGTDFQVDATLDLIL